MRGSLVRVRRAAPKFSPLGQGLSGLLLCWNVLHCSCDAVAAKSLCFHAVPFRLFPSTQHGCNTDGWVCSLDVQRQTPPPGLAEHHARGTVPTKSLEAVVHRTAWIVGLVAVPASATAQAAPDTQAVVARWQEAKALCNSSADDSWAWCDVQDATRTVLQMRGWCFGKEDEPSHHHEWHPCEALSLGLPFMTGEVTCPQERAIYRQLNSRPGARDERLEFSPPEHGGLYDIVLRGGPEGDPLHRFTMNTSANMEFIFIEELDSILGIDVKPDSSIELSAPRPPGALAVQYLWIEGLTSWGWRVYPSETGEELSIDSAWQLVGCR